MVARPRIHRLAKPSASGAPSQPYRRRAPACLFRAQHLQPVKQRLVKRGGVLHLRRVAKVREFDQLRVRDRACREFGEAGIVAEPRADLRRRQILTDRRGILVADEQQRRHCNSPNS